MQKTFYIYTWGCQMNEDDTSQLSSFLMQKGYVPAEKEEDSDIFILITCSVREKPENKAKSKLGELRILKETRPDVIIGVCGCMAQREGEQLKKGRPYLNFVVGTQNISSIPNIIDDILDRQKFKSSLALSENLEEELIIPKRTLKSNVNLKEFIPIMYGCNNFCSYCIVPYVRGRERSRDYEDIIGEIKYMADRGCVEVTLLGQNVNSYGQTLENSIDFAELLHRVTLINGIERIRFTTSHPKDLSDNLISVMASSNKICKHIHLAVQSGDTEVLANMNRRYDNNKIYELSGKLRSVMPDIALSTDLIVGFPGEGEKEFQSTIKMVEDIQFDWAYMFSFNPIPNTPAAKLDNQMTMKEKNARLTNLIKVQNTITLNKNKSLIDKTFSVLVESISPKNVNTMTGFTSQCKTVNFKGDASLTGKIVDIKVKNGHLYGFTGELLDE